MARCAVYKCINGKLKKGAHKTQKEKVVYHKFPKNKKYAAIWWQATKRRRPEPCKSDFICSDHFTSDSYIRDLQHELLNLPTRKRLKEDAIPTLNLPATPQEVGKKSKFDENFEDDYCQEHHQGKYIFQLQEDIEPLEQNDLKQEKNEAKLENETWQYQLECPDSSGLEFRLKTRSKKTIKTRMQDQSRKHTYTKANIDVESSWDEDTLQRVQNHFHCQTVMRDMFHDEALMDVILVTGNSKIKAHRAVLRQASGYFRRILTLDIGVEFEIPIEHIDYEDLTKIVKFVYMGEVSIRSSALASFLKAAEQLEIFSLLLFPGRGQSNDVGQDGESAQAEELQTCTDEALSLKLEGGTSEEEEEEEELVGGNAASFQRHTTLAGGGDRHMPPPPSLNLAELCATDLAEAAAAAAARDALRYEAATAAAAHGRSKKAEESSAFGSEHLLPSMSWHGMTPPFHHPPFPR